MLGSPGFIMLRQKVAQVVQEHVTHVACEGPDSASPTTNEIPYPVWIRCGGVPIETLSRAGRSQLSKQDEEVAGFMAFQMLPTLQPALADEEHRPFGSLDKAFNANDENFVRFVRRAQACFQESLVLYGYSFYEERIKHQRANAAQKRKAAEEAQTPEKKPKQSTSSSTGNMGSEPAARAAGAKATELIEL